MAVVGISVDSFKPNSFANCVLTDMLEDNRPKVGVKKWMPVLGTENKMNPNANPTHMIRITIYMPVEWNCNWLQ